jgi:hypothetical protein
MRWLFFILILITPIIASAQQPPCELKLPVDSSEEAFCAGRNYFIRTSCISKYGFSRKITEDPDRWTITISDRNPNPAEGCKILQIAVCKLTGKIVFSASDECAT